MKALKTEKKTDGLTYNRTKSDQDSVRYRQKTEPDFVGSGFHPPERFVPLLAKFSHPANATHRAQLFNQLQRQYGNRYVQRVVAAYRAKNAEEDEDKLALEIISKKGSGRPLEPGNMTVQRLFKSGAIRAKQASPLASHLMPFLQLRGNEQDADIKKEAFAIKRAAVQRNVQRSYSEDPVHRAMRFQPFRLVSVGDNEGRNHLESMVSLGTSESGSSVPYRAEMEQRFGADLGNVRAHRGTLARKAAKGIGTEAFTVGNDVVFGSSYPDRATVAHELTHVLQQRRTSALQASGVTSHNDPTEQEARAVEKATRNGLELPSISASLTSTTVAGDWPEGTFLDLFPEFREFQQWMPAIQEGFQSILRILRPVSREDTIDSRYQDVMFMNSELSEDMRRARLHDVQQRGEAVERRRFREPGGRGRVLIEARRAVELAELQLEQKVMQFQQQADNVDVAELTLQRQQAGEQQTREEVQLEQLTFNREQELQDVDMMMTLVDSLLEASGGVTGEGGGLAVGQGLAAAIRFGLVTNVRGRYNGRLRQLRQRIGRLRTEIAQLDVQIATVRLIQALHLLNEKAIAVREQETLLRNKTEDYWAAFEQIEGVELERGFEGFHAAYETRREMTRVVTPLLRDLNRVFSFRESPELSQRLQEMRRRFNLRYRELMGRGAEVSVIPPAYFHHNATVCDRLIQFFGIAGERGLYSEFDWSLWERRREELQALIFGEAGAIRLAQETESRWTTPTGHGE
jgi:hypothetical protein